MKTAMARIAVIGVGVMGVRHARAVRHTASAELAAVVDLDLARAASVARELSCPAYQSVAELLHAQRLDGAIVCTADQHHRSPAEQLAHAGVGLLVEKPLALNCADAAAIVEAAAAADVPLMVGHTLRYDPRYIAAAEAVKAGDLGEILHGSVRRYATVPSGRRVGGRAPLPLFQTIHDVDAIAWVSGQPIMRVYAEEIRRVHADLGVADALVATLVLENGAVVALESSWVLPEGNPFVLEGRLDLTGTKGTIRLQTSDQGVAVFSHGNYVQPETTYSDPNLPILKAEIADFVAMLHRGTTPRATGSDGLRAVQVATALIMSVREMLPVEI